MNRAFIYYLLNWSISVRKATTKPHTISISRPHLAYRVKVEIVAFLGFMGIIVSSILLGNHLSKWFILILLFLIPAWKYSDYLERYNRDNARPWPEIFGGQIAMVIAGATGLSGDASCHLLVFGGVFGIAAGIAWASQW